MTPDVIVVGGGLAGCSVAWHLASTHRVLLIEQGDHPGGEATAQNAGMLRTMGEDPTERALALRTQAWMAEQAQGAFEDFPEPVSTQTGAVLALAHDPAHLTDAVAHLRARGEHLERLSDPSAIAPVLAGARLAEAWYQASARIVDPHALNQGLLAGLRRLGGQVRANARVAEVHPGRVVLASGAVLSAEHVVLATGAWSAQLSQSMGIRRPFVPIRRAVMHSGPHPLSTPGHPWTWIDDVGVYVRPESGGWLMSACDERVDYPAPGPGSQGSVPEATRALLSDKLQRHLPALAQARPAGGWTGLRTFAPDRRPALGADPERPGLWWAAGLGGFGVSCSVGVGQALAAWIRGEDTPWLHAGSVNPGRPHPSRWLIRPDGDLRHAKLAGAFF